MIKDIFGFVNWQWQKFEFWQKAFMVSSFFFGIALASEPPYTFYFSLVPMTIVFGFITKWIIWDGTKSAWNRYQKEKYELFQTIKDSEK